MRRLFARSIALALVTAGPALACINDSELPSQEQEFRSQYTRAARKPAPVAATTSRWPVVAGGLAMLGSAAALVLLDGRSRR